MGRTAEDYTRALQTLMPIGQAWPTDPDATLTRLLWALANPLARGDYPHLAAEVEAGGAPDLPTAVAMVEAEQAAWTQASAAIKQARRAGKLAVAAATTPEAVAAARDTALAALDALRAAP
jgi:hypothetical protein